MYEEKAITTNVRRALISLTLGVSTYTAADNIHFKLEPKEHFTYGNKHTLARICMYMQITGMRRFFTSHSVRKFSQHYHQ
jgi:hypothetical protein